MVHLEYLCQKVRHWFVENLNSDHYHEWCVGGGWFNMVLPVDMARNLQVTVWISNLER